MEQMDSSNPAPSGAGIIKHRCAGYLGCTGATQDAAGAWHHCASCRAVTLGNNKFVAMRRTVALEEKYPVPQTAAQRMWSYNERLKGLGWTQTMWDTVNVEAFRRVGVLLPASEIDYDAMIAFLNAYEEREEPSIAKRNSPLSKYDLAPTQPSKHAHLTKKELVDRAIKQKLDCFACGQPLGGYYTINGVDAYKVRTVQMHIPGKAVADFLGKILTKEDIAAGHHQCNVVDSYRIIPVEELREATLTDLAYRGVRYLTDAQVRVEERVTTSRRHVVS